MINNINKVQSHSTYLVNHEHYGYKLDQYQAQQQRNKEDDFQKQQQNVNFSIECDQLLESMSQFCDDIQAQGYRNIKCTNEIMKKFKMLKAFKDSIDEHWQKIMKNMIKFLKSDQDIIKCYSQTKSKIIQGTYKIQDCQNYQDLRQITKFLQDSAKLQVTNNKIRFNHSQQDQLQQKIKTWKITKQQIQDNQQVIKDYAIKIIEIVTDEPINLFKEEHNENKKLNTQEYFRLRQQINSELNAKAEGSSDAFCSTRSARSDSIKEEETFKNNGKQKMRNSSKSYRKKSELIRKILDLYKHQQL